MSDASHIALCKFLKCSEGDRKEFFEALRRQGYVVSRATAATT